MNDKLVAQRQEAESTFNAVQNSINVIQAELKKYGAETIADLEAELLRLQGEYRAINKALEVSEKPKGSKSKKADTIDATEVDKD